MIFIAVFGIENGADRDRSMVSSSLRQGPVGPLFKVDSATFVSNGGLRAHPTELHESK